MSKVLSIEYCTSWGYVPKAVGLAEKLLREHKIKISSLIIVPSTGGVFEVKLDDELIFSKKSLGRFPEEDEVEKIVREKL